MTKHRVGITGQIGFIGSHLSYYLGLKSDEIDLIPFEDEYFEDEGKFKEFLLQCDTVVHLAAMNRGNEDELYDCNVGLVKKLIAFLGAYDQRPHVIFSSSTQESRDNAYGWSKKEGRRLLSEWAAAGGGRVTSLIIPNVFGCFGLPFYNSVVSTFCHQLTHGEQPEIHIDAELPLIYVNDLARKIYGYIVGPGQEEDVVRVRPTANQKVSDILGLLTEFKSLYVDQNIIPELNSGYEVAMFNTFRSYLAYDYFPVMLTTHNDDRGSLFELVKAKVGGQAFLSTTKPGIVRGNHFHTRKIERFCVVRGEAVVRLRKLRTDRVIQYDVSGDAPAVVDIPLFHTHNIENTGSRELVTVFWSNELFDPEDSDTYYEGI